MPWATPMAAAGMRIEVAVMLVMALLVMALVR